MASISSSSLSDASSLSDDESFHFPFPVFTVCEVSAFRFFTTHSIEALGAFPFPVFFNRAIDMEKIANIANMDQIHKTISQQPISKSIRFPPCNSVSIFLPIPSTAVALNTQEYRTTNPRHPNKSMLTQ